MLAPLKPGDKIAIVALARKVNYEDILPAITILNSWGLEVLAGKTLKEDYHQFAGTDEIRVADFQQMLDNPEIKAIFSARGGYGTTRIIDKIDFTKFKQQPKWVIGFSDITALLCHIHNFNIESIHGTMPALFAKAGAKNAVESLRKVLFGEEISYQAPANELNKTGNATSILIGGNLSLLASCVGTSSDIETAGKILFLEDLDEYLYNIDRMIVQLDRAGKLKSLAGLVVGDMSDMKDNAVPFGKNAYEIIQEHCGKYSYPMAFGFPAGHEPENQALIFGRNVILEVTESGTTLDYKPENI